MYLHGFAGLGTLSGHLSCCGVCLLCLVCCHSLLLFAISFASCLLACPPFVIPLHVFNASANSPLCLCGLVFGQHALCFVAPSLSGCICLFCVVFLVVLSFAWAVCSVLNFVHAMSAWLPCCCVVFIVFRHQEMGLS